MADDLQGRIDAAIQRRIDAAIERKKHAADPVSGAVSKVSGQSGDDLAYRGQILPLGRTKEGNIVPALPQAFQDAAKMTKGAIETGQMPTVPEALGAGLAFSPVGAASRGAARALIPGRAEGIMSTEELNAAKSAAYKASEESGYTIQPQPFETMVRSLVPELKKSGFDVGMTPGAANMITRLAKEVGEGKAKTLEELDIFRKLARSNANQANRSGNDTDKALNIIIKDKIDEFIEDQTAVVGGSGLKKARELALRASKAEEIDDIMNQSITRGGEYRASGMENAWRAEFAKLAKNNKKMARYTKEEQDAIKEAGRTEGAAQKGLITLGKLSPTAGALGLIGALGTAEVAHYLQHPEFLAIPAAGMIARYAATKMREKSVDVLQGLVKGGKGMSDYRVQQAMRGRSMGADLQRAGLMGAGGMMPKQQPQQPDQFNPLLNPGAT